jgi:hypothetical protein
MKVYKSEKGCPISFENSLVAKPTTAWLPFSRWREQGAGGMRVEQHWFARGGVYGFCYARIVDPCYEKRGVKRVSEPVLRKRKEHLSNDQPTHCLQAALAIPEGSKPLAGAKRQRHLQ